jgi:hypothetical protein
VFPARVTCGNSNNLRVTAAVIGHVEDTHRANFHTNAWKEWVFGQKEEIYRVAIQAQRVLEIAVVGGIHEGRVENTVEIHPTGLVVDYKLVPAATRDFDNGGVVGHDCGLLVKKVS